MTDGTPDQENERVVLNTLTELVLLLLFVFLLIGIHVAGEQTQLRSKIVALETAFLDALKTLRKIQGDAQNLQDELFVFNENTKSRQRILVKAKTDLSTANSTIGKLTKKIDTLEALPKGILVNFESILKRKYAYFPLFRRLECRGERTKGECDRFGFKLNIPRHTDLKARQALNGDHNRFQQHLRDIIDFEDRRRTDGKTANSCVWSLDPAKGLKTKDFIRVRRDYFNPRSGEFCRIWGEYKTADSIHLGRYHVLNNGRAGPKPVFKMHGLGRTPQPGTTDQSPFLTGKLVNDGICRSDFEAFMKWGRQVTAEAEKAWHCVYHASFVPGFFTPDATGQKEFQEAFSIFRIGVSSGFKQNQQSAR